MGGGVVQHLVGRIDRPALSGAVLLASMPPAGVWRVTLDTARQRTGTFLAANVRRDLGMLVVEPEHVRRMFLSPDTDDSVVAAVRSRLHGESFRAFLDMLALDRPRPASGRGPRATEVRVLGAADDTIFRVADVEATAAAWGTEAVIVPGIGHDVMLDHGWERVADQVIAWVREMG
jgi:pimeloyl-ACP methyl ester carboxylesterase